MGQWRSAAYAFLDRFLCALLPSSRAMASLFPSARTTPRASSCVRRGRDFPFSQL